jgi:CheY-like chemotaxis protein
MWEYAKTPETRQWLGVAGRPAPRVLVVDDDHDTADVFSELFRLRWCCDAKAAYDARHAIELAKTLRPMLVCLDIKMPGTDGFALSRELRSVLGPEQTYIVAVSGLAYISDKCRAAKAGIDLHLAKPLDKGAMGVMLGLSQDQTVEPTSRAALNTAEICALHSILTDAIAMGNWFLDDPESSDWARLGGVARIQDRQERMLAMVSRYAPHQTELTIALGTLSDRCRTLSPRRMQSAASG